MPTNTVGQQARRHHTQQTHYLWLDLTYAMNGTQKTVGWLPVNAIVTAVRVAVDTAFDDTGTDYVDVGTVADPDGFAADVDVSSKGIKLPTTIATSDDCFTASTETKVVAQYDGQNSNAAAGACTVIVEYIVKQ